MKDKDSRHFIKGIPYTKIDKKIVLKDINNLVPCVKGSERLSINDDIINKISKMELSKYLMIFTKTIISNFKEEDIQTFYKNIKTLTIKEFNINIFNDKNKSETLAYYRPTSNSIHILNEDNIDSIYHELFHMSTCKRIGSVLFNGFRQVFLENNTSYGLGINEGYTQLLSERYFPDSMKGKYNYFVYALLLIEEIIGKEKMESLYMNSNLYGLTDELKKYASYEDICRFITYTDYLIKVMYNKKIDNRTLSIISGMCEYVNMFAIDSFLNKCKLNNPESDEEYTEMANKVVNFLNQTISAIKINDKIVNCSVKDNKSYMLKLVSDLDELELDINYLRKKKKL